MEKILVDEVAPVQVIPSLEYAIELVPSPTATHIIPFHATYRPLVEKIDVDEVAPVQVVPSLEYAIELVALPTATHIVPFHATPNAKLEKVDVPNPVQLIPL